MTMIKFNLSSNFKMVQEGERTLEIVECTPTPSGHPTEMKWTLRDVEDGATMKDSCNITDKSTNVWKLSRIASAVLNVQDGQEMDAKELANALLNKKVLCEIVHNQGKQAREDGTFPTFANISKVISLVEDTNDTVTNDNPRNLIAGL